MKKLNNKGFMMAELIVVSAVIIGTMATFYLSYSKIVIRYNKLINYYDVGTIYRIAHYHKSNPTDFELTGTETKQLSEKTDTINGHTYKDNLYIGICKNMTNYTTNDEELKDYLSFFKSIEGMTSNTNKCAILKSCLVLSGDKKNKCKFAYVVIEDED